MSMGCGSYLLILSTILLQVDEFALTINCSCMQKCGIADSYDFMEVYKL